MSTASGPIKSIKLDSETFRLPNDNETNFWPGGFVTTEAQDDIGGSTRKTEFIAGKLTGVTARLAKPGEVKRFRDALRKTVEGDVPCVITMPNDDKWTAPVYIVIDPTSFVNNTDMKGTYDICTPDGEFLPTS